MANKYFLEPFAQNGDKTAIANTTPDGEISYDTGYSADYEIDKDVDPAGARDVERRQFNQLMNDVTGNLKTWQEFGYPEWIADSDGIGTPFSYEKGVVVVRNGSLYISDKNANVSDPLVSDWSAFTPSRGLIDNYTELKALPRQSDYLRIYINNRATDGDLGGGLVSFVPTDLSSQVAADTQQGIFIPPDFQPDGSQGAYVRVILDGKITPSMFGAVGGGVDDTLAIQGAFDSSFKHIHCPLLYSHTFNEISNGQTVTGNGTGTGFRQVDGIRYYNGTATGSYGLSCKSGITWCAVYNLEYDGNNTASFEYSDSYSEMWDGSSFVRGRVKQGGIAFTQLNRVDWVPPVHVWVDRVYSHSNARNCFIFQLPADVGGSGNPAGTAHVGMIWAKNSDIDHLIYSDDSDICTFSQVFLQGHSNGGHIVTSGSQFDQVVVRDITANPISTVDFDLQTLQIVHDRGDTRGSNIKSLNVKGDLFNLDDSNTQIRKIMLMVGRDSQYGDIYVEHTGTAIVSVTGFESSSAAGTRRDQNINSVSFRNMPQGFLLYVHDRELSGIGLQGVKIGDVKVHYMASVVSNSTWLISLDGNSISDFLIDSLRCVTDDNTEGGASSILRVNNTGNLTNLRINNVYAPNTDNAVEPYDITVGGDIKNVVFDNWNVRNKRLDFGSIDPEIKLVNFRPNEGSEAPKSVYFQPFTTLDGTPDVAFTTPDTASSQCSWTFKVTANILQFNGGQRGLITKVFVMRRNGGDVEVEGEAEVHTPILSASLSGVANVTLAKNATTQAVDVVVTGIGAELHWLLDIEAIRNDI